MKLFLIIIIVIIGVFLLGLSLVIFLIKPNKKRDLKRFEGEMFAHRGLHDNFVPENSLAAFSEAKKAGHGVELDVQLTKDNQVVVFHDASLKRMCNVSLNVCDLTFNELQGFNLLETDEKIPLFSQVLDVLDGMSVICEIKFHNGFSNDFLCEQTAKLLESYHGDFCVESFSPFILKWFKKNRPDIIRGQLANKNKKDSQIPFYQRVMLVNLLVNAISRPDFIAFCFSDINSWGYRLCKWIFNPLCIGWTARGEKEIETAQKHFDTIIFEKGVDNSLLYTIITQK